MRTATAIRNAVIVAVLAIAPCASAQQEVNDDGWIASYVASGKAPGITRPKNQDRQIGFELLSGIVGKRARFEMVAGKERIGVVESVKGDTVFVRTLHTSGFSSYSLARRDIRAIRLD